MPVQSPAVQPVEFAQPEPWLEHATAVPRQTRSSYSQLGPDTPAMHAQRYVLGSFVHVPPFKHGLPAHSSTSSAQPAPVHPGGQLQLYEPTVLKHRSPGRQGSFVAHSSMSKAHVGPVKPYAQLHPKPPAISTHVPPFVHGFAMHGCAAYAQRFTFKRASACTHPTSSSPQLTARPEAFTYP